MVSESDNVAELRFFNRVEGGVCSQPSWTELAQLNVDGRLDHLMPAAFPGAPLGQPDPRWPAEQPLPNPGTLSHTRYPNLFPVGVLLNNHLFADPSAAADWRQASFDCLVVGLGSGVSVIAAAHFINASITVVDIDQVVIDMVREYYPLFDWLAGDGDHAPMTADGRQRLQLVAQDARQFVRQAQSKYDLIVLDAYTSGSTIPPHLMTREFFGMLAGKLDAGGIVLSNIIGSYTGKKRSVLTGAMRHLFQAAAKPDGQPVYASVHNFPLLNRDAAPESFRADWSRNNILLAGTESLTPKGNPAGWQRLQAVIDRQQLYELLPRQTYMTRMMMGVGQRGKRYSTAMVPLPEESPLWQAMSQQGRLTTAAKPLTTVAKPWRSVMIQDPALIRQAVEYAQEHVHPDAQFGWHVNKLSKIEIYESDLVGTARQALASSVAIARQTIGSAYAHGADLLVGPSDLLPEQRATARWQVPDAPLFTDQRMNADLYTD